MLEEKDKTRKQEIDILHMIDKKANLLIEILYKKSVIATEEVKQFKDFQIFPKIE